MTRTAWASARRRAHWSALSCALPIAFSLSLVDPASAYFERVQAGARATAFGRAYSAIADDASALFYNPAALVTVRRAEVMGMLAKPFNVGGYQASYVAAALPRDGYSLGAYWHHAGVSDVVGENLIAVGAARDLLPPGGNIALAAGCGLKLAQVGFASDRDVDYGSETAFTADLAALLNVGARVALSYTVHNLIEPEIEFVDGQGATALERTHDFGSSLRWNDASTVAFAISKDAFGEWNGHLGGEVWFHDVFSLRSGFWDGEFAGGVGLRATRYLVDVAFLTNEDLGVSYEVALRLPFGASR